MADDKKDPKDQPRQQAHPTVARAESPPPRATRKSDDRDEDAERAAAALEDAAHAADPAERDRLMARTASTQRRRPALERTDPAHVGPGGVLTREGMEAAIRAGGSVMHDGRVIDTLDDLPDAAELAAGDENRERMLVESYDDQIARLQREKAAAQERFKAQGPKEPKK